MKSSRNKNSANNAETAFIMLAVIFFLLLFFFFGSALMAQTGANGPANGWTVWACSGGCPPDSNFATTFYDLDSGYQSFSLKKRERVFFENKSHQMGALGDTIVLELRGNTNYFSSTFGGNGFYLYFSVIDTEKVVTISLWWYVEFEFSELRIPAGPFMDKIHELKFSFGTTGFDTLSQAQIDSLVHRIDIRRAYMIVPGGGIVDFPHFQYTTSVVDEIEEGIARFELFQNYPNPFNPSTVISYQLAVDSKVSVRVYDVLGNEVTVLVDEEKSAGSYEVNFDASKLSNGVYFYKLQAGDFVQTKKMILMK